jgi:predicted AlkP superfamily pyrophosphatase or phosphodiesterase
MGYEGYFYLYAVPVELLPYFNYCEKRDIFRPGGINRGRSIFDLLEERSIPFRSYSYHQYTDQEIIRAAIHDVEQEAAQFYFLYLSEMDMFLHRHCQEPEKVDAKVALYDRWLRQLYERALAAGGDIVMYVFSDHGMVPTTSTRDLWSEIEHLGFKVPRDYLPFYDSTMARFWFFSTAARDRITSYLSSLDCGHILTSEERQEFGVDFPDGRFGEAVFLMNPGCLTVPSYLGKGTLKGMHGFHPSAPFSSGALVSTVELPMPVGTLTDVYRLMELAVY